MIDIGKMSLKYVLGKVSSRVLTCSKIKEFVCAEQWGNSQESEGTKY